MSHAACYNKIVEKFSYDIEAILDAFFRPLLAIIVLMTSIIVARVVSSTVKKIVVSFLSNKNVNKISKKPFNLLPNTSIERRTNRIDTLATSIGSFASFLVYMSFFLWALTILEISLGKLLTGAGLIGVALGFGAQSLVKDLLSGFFILSEDWYGVGDYVDLGEDEGSVSPVSLRSTTVRDYSGVYWSIPNGEISRAGNKSSGWARIVIDIPVLYSTNVDSAKEAIQSALTAYEKNENGLFIEVPTLLGVQDLTANSSILRVIAKTKAGEQYEVSRELKNDIKVKLEAKKIEMPKGFVQ